MKRRHATIDFNSLSIAPFLSGRRLVSHRALNGGLSSSVYLLELETNERYVLKANDPAIIEREANVLRMAAESLPVPRVLHHQSNWMVMSFVQGESLDKHPEAMENAAELIGRLKQFRFEKPGNLTASLSIEPWDFDGLDGFILKSLNTDCVQKWLSLSCIKSIQKIIERESGYFRCLNQESGLVHGDYKTCNLLASGGHVTAILDWEHCYSGAFITDVGQLVREISDDGILARVARGLTRGGLELPDDWLFRARMADLSSHLEFLSSTLSDSFKQTRVRLLEEFVRSYI